jgi:hypothetical protein
VAVAGSTFFFIVLCQWFLIELSVLQEDPQAQMPSSPQSVCEQKCVCKLGPLTDPRWMFFLHKLWTQSDSKGPTNWPLPAWQELGNLSPFVPIELMGMNQRQILLFCPSLPLYIRV